MNIKNTMMILSLCFILSLTLVSAIEIEPVKQGEGVELYQTCNNCTYCNFTRISAPDNSTLLSNIEPSQDGTYYYFWLAGGNTTTLGPHKYCYDCGNAEDSQTGCIRFPVTPSGRQGNDNIALYIILIVMIYTVTLLSFFGRNIILSALTGMMMTFFGVWIVRNGIVIYRDNLTNYFGYVTMFIGSIVALTALVEWIQDTF